MSTMFSMTYATIEDKPHFVNQWENLPESEYESKIRDKRCYVIRHEDKPIGYMRYNLIFDFVPFLTCFYIVDPHKRKGFGKQAMLHWESVGVNETQKQIIAKMNANPKISAKAIAAEIGIASRNVEANIKALNILIL